MKSGAEQLKDWMHRRRFMAREAAEYFGWHESFISQLINSVRTPGLENAVKIERESGIPVEAWLPTEGDKSGEAVSVSAAKSRRDKA